MDFLIMENEIRKLPPTPDDLVQIARREKNPSQFYIVSSGMDMYSAPESFGLAILYDTLERNCKDVRKTIYELANEIPSAPTDQIHNHSSSKCDNSIINAFELGSYDKKNNLYPIGFYHIPVEYYTSVCKDSDRLENELLDIIVDSL